MDKLRNIGFLIKDINRAYTRVYEERVEHLDVTLSQCRALVYISKNEGISQARLAYLTGIEPMSLVRILDRMEADHWIERRVHPSDRRARQLYLKPQCKPTLEQIWKLGDEVRSEMLSGFKSEERAQLLNLLERARDNLLKASPDDMPVSKASDKDSVPAGLNKSTGIAARRLGTRGRDQKSARASR